MCPEVGKSVDVQKIIKGLQCALQGAADTESNKIVYS